MYWPTSTAKVLSPTLSLPRSHPLPIIHASLNARKTLFCTITEQDICIWGVRPTVILAELRRSREELALHGNNVWIGWAPDGSRLVVQTNDSHLILLSLTYAYSPPSYELPKLPHAAARQFSPAPGEGYPIQSISVRMEGVVKLEGGPICLALTNTSIYFSARDPPSIQRISFPSHPMQAEVSDISVSDRAVSHTHVTVLLQDFTWLPNSPNLVIEKMSFWRKRDAWGWIMSDGTAYFVKMGESPKSAHSQESLPVEDFAPTFTGIPISLPSDGGITCMTPNFKFSVLMCGTSKGELFISHLPPGRSLSHIRSLSPHSLKPRGLVHCADWTSDGYAVAASWDGGWGVWSVGGRELGGGSGAPGTSERFVSGVGNLFWSMGNLELFMLAPAGPNSPADQLFSIPFAKSAVTGQQAPDNARYAFLQMDDRVLVYRGADQPDMSVINPESDVWQNIKIPPSYIATNWPIRYATISADGRLIAVAGRRGLVHYSSASGRWKMFVDETEEQAFAVRGGLVWFHHVLVAAVEADKSFQVRLYSRDTDLSHRNILHIEHFSSPVLVLSLVDNSLLVYTADNNLFHFLILPTRDNIQLHLCGSISFNGVVHTPALVRGMSWMIPAVQKQLGDPTDDLIVATVILLVGGRLVLLRPRKAGTDEVRYDMQILSECIEFCWTHLRGAGTLENSLWGFDGADIRVWLDALTIEAVEVDNEKDAYESVKESVRIPLESYPLSVLTDKGVVIGVEPEFAMRESLPFAMFKIVTTSHLFIQYVLRFHLDQGQLDDAVDFASCFEELVYFSHALEILLHSILEDVEDSSVANGALGHAIDPVLPLVVAFLDHFDDALEVVVGVARKTEMARWQTLFDAVGNPRSLFEKCLTSNRLVTAGSYLLVLHTLEQLDESHVDAIRLLKSAVAAGEDGLCRELMRFLRSIDESGDALRRAITEAGLLPSEDAELKPEEGSIGNAPTDATTMRKISPLAPVPERAKRRPPVGAGLGFLPESLGGLTSPGRLSSLAEVASEEQELLHSDEETTS